MKAMILAAGRGERMRPLTDALPKPLLEVGGKPLIVWHLIRLANAGIHEIVINHAWLGEKIETTLGNGSQFGVSIQYSAESTALETAGGIATSLPKLGNEPFLVLNGDIWCDWDLGLAARAASRLQQSDALAWLVMVPNPLHHPLGDFTLGLDDHLTDHTDQARQLTFSGIGVYQPALFARTPRGQPANLAPLLRLAMRHRQVGGERYDGPWMDIGTPDRLNELDLALRTAQLTMPDPAASQESP